MKQVYILKAASTGALLGLGAPAGYILFSYVLMNPNQLGFIEWCLFVMKHQTLLLMYLTLPTVFVFTCFGYYHGKQEARLDFKTKQMDHFMNIAVHDIKSPLAVITQAAQMVKDKISGPINRDQEMYMDIIKRQSKTMVELVTEILDIHKMESGQYEVEFQPINIVELVQKAADEMELIIKKKSGSIRVSPHVKNEEEVYADAFRIRQVFRNIIGNACKYMPEHSQILVSILKNEKNQVEVTIANDGEQIPEEKLEKIFDKFAQARNRDHKLGYGLGLSICKNIMDLHQGRIWVENQETEGVCVHIVFNERISVN